MWHVGTVEDQEYYPNIMSFHMNKTGQVAMSSTQGGGVGINLWKLVPLIPHKGDTKFCGVFYQ
jgi:hypothetical protein